MASLLTAFARLPLMRVGCAGPLVLSLAACCLSVDRPVSEPQPVTTQSGATEPSGEPAVTAAAQPEPGGAPPGAAEHMPPQAAAEAEQPASPQPEVEPPRAAIQEVPAPQTAVQPAAPTPPQPKPDVAPAAGPKAPAPAPKTAAKPSAPVPSPPAPPAAPVPSPAASAPQPTYKAETPVPVPPLDLNRLKQQLKDTDAIGLFTKITLKNQMDDLLDWIREYHLGKGKRSLVDLRRLYDLLVMKVLSLVQDEDRKLASDILSSREAIWGLLADRQKFATLEV